jgi:hypothetical protein
MTTQKKRLPLLTLPATWPRPSSKLRALIDTHHQALRAADTASEDDDSVTKLNDAEEDAITAICSFAPKSKADGTVKARYLWRYFNNMVGAQSWHVKALLRSIAGGARV